jgi:hypothetical protein
MPSSAAAKLPLYQEEFNEAVAFGATRQRLAKAVVPGVEAAATFRTAGGIRAESRRGHTLQEVRDLCRSRKLSVSGVHTHGDIRVDHRCRSARVLYDTCDVIAKLVTEVEIDTRKETAAMQRELRLLRQAVGEWQRYFEQGDKNLTPLQLAAELASLRAQVRDLEHAKKDLARAQGEGQRQLHSYLKAATDLHR